jgi:hypothetical protein
MSTPTDNQDIINHLKSVLLEVNDNPYPEVACPDGVPKRASVALILRVQPRTVRVRLSCLIRQRSVGGLR